MNNPPTGTDGTLLIDEDQAYTLTLADFGFVDDVDNLLSVTIVTVPTAGRLTWDPDGAGGDEPIDVIDGDAFGAADIAAGWLVFTPAADESGLGYASFTFLVQDDGGTDDGGSDFAVSSNTLTFDVGPVNDAPILDLDFTDFTASGVDAAAVFVEDGGPVALAPYAFVSDSDSVDFDGGSLTVSFTGGTADDQLTIADIGDQPGELGVDGSNVTYGGVPFGTWSGGANGADLVLSFNADACACAVQLLAANILYSNAATDILAASMRGVTFTFNDGDGGTANASVTLDLVPVNDAPTGTDGTIIIDEDQAYTLTTADFGFDDSDGNALLAVTIDSAPGYGSLTLDDDGDSGTDPIEVFAGDMISGADIAAGRLMFTPYPDENGTAYDSFTFTVQDDGGTDDGGSDTANSSNTITFDVTPVNDAPYLDLDFFDGDASLDTAATYVEGGAPVTLAPFAFVDDVDSDDFDGGSLTISIAGATADDQLNIASIGEDFGEIALDGQDVTYEGVVVGTWSGGDNGNPLTIEFNDEACLCAIELIAANILYENSAADITAPDTRTLTFTFNDGSPDGSTNSTSAEVTLDIVPANEPPEILLPASVTGDEDSVIALGGISVTDVETDPATGLVTMRLTVANGALTLRTDIAGGIAAADIAIGNGSGSITVIATLDQINATLAVSDGLTYLGNAEFSGADELGISVYDASPADTIDIAVGPFEPAPDFPSAVLLTDLDGDGDSELVIGSYAFSPVVSVESSTIDVIVNTGGVIEMVAADLDGDGVQELIVADYGEFGDDGAVRIISFAGGSSYSMTVIGDVSYASAVAVADFDGDGVGDIVAADADAGRVAILLGAGGYAPVFYAAMDFVVDVAAGDVNGDGFADIVFAGDDGTGGNSSVRLMLGNGDGTFQGATEILAPSFAAASLILSDLNGDGLLDIAFSAEPCGCVPGEEAGVFVLIGSGGGSFTPPGFYATSADGTAAAIAAADMNGDGLDDLIVANADLPGTLSILVNNGDGSFQAAQQVSSGGSYPVGFGVHDSDRDGDNDLVIANLFGNTIDFLINNAWGRGTRSTLAITVNAVDDPAVAVDDTATTDEDMTVSIGVLNNDTDIDGPARSVVTIDGEVAVIGIAIELASGATATLEIDGTITYDPNHAFDTLTGAGSGASNTSGSDSFDYSINGGATATVTVTVNGVAGAGDRLRGGMGNDTITGTPDIDLIMLNDGGDDIATGSDSNDGFYMGSELSAGDDLDGGGGTLDQLGLQGNYSGFTFGAGNLQNIEMVVLLSGIDTRFGDPGTSLYSYDIATVDENVGAGEQLIVSFNTLREGESVTFDGSAEQDGHFLTYGGQGQDDLTGGQQDDGFYFGTGRWGIKDRVDGQGGTMDQIGFQGDYAGANGIVFGADQMTNVEMIVLVAADDTRFGGSGVSYSYSLVMDDGNVGVGQMLSVSANRLGATEVLTFDASAELDGIYTVYSGSGDDWIHGGANGDFLFAGGGEDRIIGGGGGDYLRGAAGDDVFAYLLASDSTATSRDEILDFAAGDRIDLSAIDADSNTAGMQGFSFIGAAGFGGNAGELRVSGSGGTWLVDADLDGDGTADFSIQVTASPTYAWGAADFILI